MDKSLDRHHVLLHSLTVTSVRLVKLFNHRSVAECDTEISGSLVDDTMVTHSVSINNLADSRVSFLAYKGFMNSFEPDMSPYISKFRFALLV